MPSLQMYAIQATIETSSGNRQTQRTVNVTSGSTDKHYKWNIVWRNVVIFAILHLISFYAIFLVVFQRKWTLFVYCYAYGIFVAQGITAGAHRLWSHRAYKATKPLQLLLLFLQTSAFQNSVYVWVRDHRLHHKYTDTDADPHNARRGFFFSHMGWLLLRKEEAVKEKGRRLDMDDITSDPLLMWQHRYYLPLMAVCCFVIPTVIPWYFWNENYLHSFVIAGAFRYIFSVHSTWLVNSVAHIYGMKPYDRSIAPTENAFVSFMACGEGFHNYHHVFPWDYKTSELGRYAPNWTLAVINFFAAVGWAYDLKTVSGELVAKRARRTGDGTRRRSAEEEGVDDGVRGDMDEADVEEAVIINKKV